jgi:hypothetical protein
VNDSAFRGTSSVPSDPANESGAAYFAGEGGYVYEIRRVPTWDVNKALQGRVGQTGSIRGNLMHGEGEYAIPARVTPDKIKRWGVVKSNSRGQLYVEWHEGSPAAPAQPAAKTSPQADVEDTSIKGGGKSQPGPRATEPQREMEEDPKAGRTPVSAKSREEAAEDLKRIRQLEAWDQQGKLTGDVGGLRSRLRSNEQETAREARKEFDEVQQQIKDHGRADIEEFADRPQPKARAHKPITDTNKTELENSKWLKDRLPDADDRRSFMDRLKAGHKEGEMGQEIDPGKKGEEGHKGSHHPPYSREKQEALRQWEEETGRKVNWQRGDIYYERKIETTPVGGGSGSAE